MRRYITFLKEKVSDVDGVRDRAIEEFRKQVKINKLEYLFYSGRNIKYSILLYKDKQPKENIKITFHFGKYDTSRFKDTYPNRWDIYMDTSDFGDDVIRKNNKIDYSIALDILEQTIVHEITHASQMINKSIAYSRGRLWDTKKGEYEQGKYGVHASKPVEQEAVLVELLYLIKKNRYKEAWDKIKYATVYFRNFSFQDIVKKAYSIDIQKDQFINFQKFALKDVKNKLSLDEYDKNDLKDNPNMIIKSKSWGINNLKVIFSETEYKRHLSEFINFFNKAFKDYPNETKEVIKNISNYKER